MWMNIREHSWAILLSLTLHAVLIGLMLFSLGHKPVRTTAGAPKPEPIKAVAVNESQVQEQMKKLRQEEQRKQNLEEARRKKLADEAVKAREERLREQKRLSDLKQRQAEEQKKLKEQKRIQQEKQRKEQLRLAELKKKQDEEKQALEKIRKEKETLERQRKEAEEKRIQEEKARKAEQRRKEEEARKAALQKQIEAEEQAERRRELKTLEEKYKAAIRGKVQRNWLRPAGVKKGDSCIVLVTQTPGGFVVSVKVTQCTASGPFQRSVETAVLKAEPLPPPPDKSVFDREIRFTFMVED